jgi:cytochrome P450
MAEIPDPFSQARRDVGVCRYVSEQEVLPMILRHADVRHAAKNWEAYSSDAAFRVPIPSEEHLRGVRQLPIETDPPEHGDYRKIVEAFFLRAKQPAYMARVQAIVEEVVESALRRENIEVVTEIALPIQSRALTILLGVSEEEAERFIEWGVHVFHGPRAVEQAKELERYLAAQFEKAEDSPGDDFYGLLTKAKYRGRALSRDEKMGFANLMFAGGRDTIIHSISCAIAYLAGKQHALAYLRQDTSRVTLAAEEIFRAFMPLTHIGRVCPEGAEVHGEVVKPGERLSLCWASANLDEGVFEDATTIRLDRRPNPHVSFGYGPHLCLGAAHSRAVMRALLTSLSTHVEQLVRVEATPHVERSGSYVRPNGYETLVVKCTPVDSGG